MISSEYLGLRKTIQALHDKIIGVLPKDKKVIMKAARQLGMVGGDAIVLESEDDSSYLMNFLLYENCVGGRPYIVDIYESEIELSSEQEEILENMMESFSSIFEIEEIDRNSSSILLKDLLAKEKSLYRLTDINLSKTASNDIILATRLIKVREFYFTSGASFVFSKNKLARLMSDLSFARFKKRGKFLASDLYVFLYRKSRGYGIEVRTEDVK
jgi:hypothetical protein